MSLATRITAFAQRVANEINTLRTEIANVGGSAPTPVVQVESRSRQTISSTAEDRIDLTDIIVNEGFTVTLGNDRIRPNTPGFYYFYGHITFSGTNGRKYITFLYKNNARYALLSRGVPGAGDLTGHGGGVLVYMNGTTDYVTLVGYAQTTAQVWDVDGYTYIGGFLVRAQ